MAQSSTIRSAFFAAWAILVALVITAIMQQDRFFIVKARPIAVLEQKEGAVVVRSEGVVRWRDAGPKQGIFDGDLLATGQEARVRVSLGPGRMLNIAEDTQVKITAIATSGKDFPFLIKLVRGTAAAEVDANCTTCAPIIVRAGDETFRVSSGKPMGITKEAGNKPVKTFQPVKNAWPVNTASKAYKPFQLAASFVAPVPAPAPPAPLRVAPPPPPPAAPVVKAAGFEAALSPPDDGQQYWTLQSQAALAQESLKYPVRMPVQRPAQGEWRPLLQVTGAGAARARTADLPMQAQEGEVSVPLAKAFAVASINNVGGLKEYAFRVRSGGEVRRGKDVNQSFNKQDILTKIVSLGEFPDGQMSFGLDSLTAEPADDSSPWLEAKELIEVAKANIAVHLVSSADYPKFLPFVRGAHKFGMSRDGLVGNDGIFVVKNQAVVAQLSGPGINKAVLDKVMNTLFADFVFKGPRSALHDTRGSSQNALVDLVGALLNKGQVLYILKRNKLYPVSREFIKTSSEVASFIDAQAKAIFLEKVDIVDYR